MEHIKSILQVASVVVVLSILRNVEALQYTYIYYVLTLKHTLYVMFQALLLA